MDNNPFDQDEQDISTSAFDEAGTTPLDEVDSSGRPLVWFLLGIAAIACGLLFAAALFFFQPDAQSLVDRYFPSPTATPTKTLTPTPTRTPTPTISPTPTLTPTPHVYLAPPEEVSVFEEKFDSNARGWDSYYSNSMIRIENGKMSAGEAKPVQDRLRDIHLRTHGIAVLRRLFVGHQHPDLGRPRRRSRSATGPARSMRCATAPAAILARERHG